jgi:hypothetical protein
MATYIGLAQCCQAFPRFNIIGLFESSFKTTFETTKAKALEFLGKANMEKNEDGSDKEIPAVMRKFFVSNEEGIQLFATLKECYETAYEEHLADR